MRYKRIAVVVLDSVGIGELPDAAAFGDAGAHTLGHLAARRPEFQLPNLTNWGLANIAPLGAWQAADCPRAYYGRMAEASVGKDTMTGHWELAGLRVDIPFQTFPDGFPEPLLAALSERTGRGIIGNKAASGTAILDELGERQLATGAWIVYTSADSVLQIAAHEDKISVEELYRACEIARELTLDPRYAVGRVIARPYVGVPGAFKRTPRRHDYAVKPPRPTVLNALADAGLDVVSVGKINDIFSGEGITASHPTVSNADGIAKTLELLRSDFRGLLFVNLVDFDSLYGHRRDPEGYAAALGEFDAALPELAARLGSEDLLIVTADHGNDPYHPGTDHTREYVPLLALTPGQECGASLGTRATFADVAATIAANFQVTPPRYGASFLHRLS
ncbi:phosphopentomutase [Paenibacillus sp. IB182496]|uniref:Phosphopentomutase n=1 Tax=Paenibacillus sabuli TaxID=2772509 RepID=A0A927BWK5_9BACL|nr:phosphopentomutase [Paenibacillus sabuli]MBD2846829.1 phosphopentomutase [Paenibacillus sabuli]